MLGCQSSDTSLWVNFCAGLLHSCLQTCLWGNEFAVLLLQEWSYLRGGLTTLDQDYGWINNIHHDIGTHVIHHLFPQIPHYHLVEAVSSTDLLPFLRHSAERWMRKMILVITHKPCIDVSDWGSKAGAWKILQRAWEIWSFAFLPIWHPSKELETWSLC